MGWIMIAPPTLFSAPISGKTLSLWPAVGHPICSDEDEFLSVLKNPVQQKTCKDPCSYIEEFVGRRWCLALQQSDGHIVNRNPSGCFSARRSMMRVAMDDQVGSMAIDDFR